MGEVGIVALSVLLGMFLLALLASSVALIWIAFRARTLVNTYAGQFASAMGDLQLAIASFRTEMNAKISAINGESLAVASNAIIKCVSRIEIASLAMGEMATMLTADHQVARTSLAPEEYDQPDAEGGRSITQSKAARLDAGTLADM